VFFLTTYNSLPFSLKYEFIIQIFQCLRNSSKNIFFFIEKYQFKFDSIKIKNFTQAFILTAKHFIYLILIYQ